MLHLCLLLKRLYILPCGVGQVRRPVFFPCCGVSVREKHVLLHLVTDMAIEEGQSNPNSRKENHQKGNA